MNHAYLIVAHNNFKILKWVLRLIDDKRNTVFLLIDKKTKISDEIYNELKNSMKLSDLFFLQRMNISWGGHSQIEAELNLIEAALNCSNKDFAYFHFLQGVDLPIKNQDRIHEYFDKNYGMEYIDFDPSTYNRANYKKEYYHFFTNNRFFRKNKFIKAMNFGLVYIQKLIKIKRISHNTLYHGSACFSITKEFAKYIIDRKKVILKEYKNTLACDEVFLQSIIMESPFKHRIANFEKLYIGNARYIDRSRPSGKNSPYVWKIDDYQDLLNVDDRICFARKFDENIDISIVEKLGNYILNENIKGI